jgi:hypothetical protein
MLIAKIRPFRIAYLHAEMSGEYEQTRHEKSGLTELPQYNIDLYSL